MTYSVDQVSETEVSHGAAAAFSVLHSDLANKIAVICCACGCVWVRECVCVREREVCRESVLDLSRR